MKTLADLVAGGLRDRTRAEFAHEAGIGTRTLQDLCAGRAVPRVATVRMLAMALDVKPEAVDRAIRRSVAQREAAAG